MSSPTNDGDQLEMFRKDATAGSARRGHPSRAKAQLNERDIAELAEIVARRVVAALPSDEKPGSAAPAAEPTAGGLMPPVRSPPFTVGIRPARDWR